MLTGNSNLLKFIISGDSSQLQREVEKAQRTVTGFTDSAVDGSARMRTVTGQMDGMSMPGSKMSQGCLEALVLHWVTRALFTACPKVAMALLQAQITQQAQISAEQKQRDAKLISAAEKSADAARMAEAQA